MIFGTIKTCKTNIISIPISSNYNIDFVLIYFPSNKKIEKM